MSRLFKHRSRDGGEQVIHYLSAILEEQKKDTSNYITGAPEKYVFSFQPAGYKEPLRVIFELPKQSIDQELGPKRRGPSEKAFLFESTAFDRLLPDLLPTLAGHYVAIHNGQVIDEDLDEFALAERIERRHRGEFVLIRRVSRDVPQDYMESPETEVHDLPRAHQNMRP